MFTGIVEEVGRISGIEQRGENRRITITAHEAPKELKTGDSVAVAEKHIPFFKTGKQLRDRLNKSASPA